MCVFKNDSWNLTVVLIRMLLSGGFIGVDDLLRLPMFKDYKMEDIQRVVTNNSKQRFALKQEPDTEKIYIRANQGHTIEVDGKT